MVRVLAFYLPQFYPTPENDEWWGRGFTEWTNVGRATPLFRDHYQPRIPADLGYYDLRLPEVRIQQAKMAKEAGIEGFCYWHYWFGGKRLLDRVFSEVVRSGIPDFPFCLCWANHSWKRKTWDPGLPDKMLMEQTYPGAKDYENHFYAMLSAFKDERYIKVNGRLLFGIFEPAAIPNMNEMSDIWNKLAIKNGLTGFCFFGLAQGSGALSAAHRKGIDMVVYDAMYDSVFIHNHQKGMRIKAKLRSIFHLPNPIEYDLYTKVAINKFIQYPDTIPCIDPNFDHSPRSGKKGTIIVGNTPKKWGGLLRNTVEIIQRRNSEGLVFIKSWNEWGEGNYLEPDLKFGSNYLKETGKILTSSFGKD